MDALANNDCPPSYGVAFGRYLLFIDNQLNRFGLYSLNAFG